MTFLPGFDPGTPAERASRTLAERFGVPPFSVLDARAGVWQERKRAWLALGIESEIGRGDSAHPIPGGGTGQNSAWLFKRGGSYESLKESGGKGEDRSAGASIFDPTLCELATVAPLFLFLGWRGG